MNAGKFFVDTNVLLYSFDSRNPFKQSRAHDWLSRLWQTGNGRLSWQVLNEFYVNAVRKLGVPAETARDSVRLFSQWNPTPVTFGLVERAWYWMDLAGVPYWDALILGSAERLGCQWLLSEDFPAGRKYEGTTIVSPFDQVPSEIGL